MAWIIENRQASYAQAAQKFGVKANSIRSRVEHRYGTLAEARGGEVVVEPKATITRPCLVCREECEFERFQHICPDCKSNML